MLMHMSAHWHNTHSHTEVPIGGDEYANLWKTAWWRQMSNHHMHNIFYQLWIYIVVLNEQLKLKKWSF